MPATTAHEWSSSNKYNYSQQLLAPLTALIMEQSEDLGEALEQQQAIKQTLRTERASELKDKATKLQNRLPQHLQHTTTLASEKGASNWLTALPLDAHGLALHRGAFRDSLCLRSTGRPLTCQQNVPAVPPSPSAMSFPAPQGDSPSSGTTTCVTSWPTSSPKFATSPLSLTSNHSVVNFSPSALPAQMIMLGLM